MLQHDPHTHTHPLIIAFCLTPEAIVDCDLQKLDFIFSRGTRAQHLTLSVSCVCVCPLDGCDALIGQRDNCTVTVSVYRCTVQAYTQPWAQHSHE